jgi:hypothetical protein
MIKRHILGLVALIIGASALTFAIVAETKGLQPGQEARKPDQETSKGFTFKLKNFSVSFGKKSQADDEDQAGASPSKFPPITIATIATAILGLIVAPISWVREKQPILSCSALGLCAAALLWHYILIGVAAAVGIVVVGFLLAHLDF